MLRSHIFLLFFLRISITESYFIDKFFFANQKVNQVVIWDKIILRGDNALLNYHGMNTKYYFFDDGLGLKYVYLS